MGSEWVEQTRALRSQASPHSGRPRSGQWPAAPSLPRQWCWLGDSHLHCLGPLEGAEGHCRLPDPAPFWALSHRTSAAEARGTTAFTR